MIDTAELRARVPLALAHRLDHALVVAAEQRGVGRVTRQQALIEAVALWLGRQDNAPSSGETVAAQANPTTH